MNQQLVENNFLVIKKFIDAQRAISLSEDFRLYAEENSLKGDKQAPNSHSCYNYISFLELLCEKTPEISKIIGETVLPSYAYSRVYKFGDELLYHKDRDACEISLTVHLNGDKTWNFFIENSRGETQSIILEPGDAILYLGCEANHWREKYEGEHYEQVFLHYVRSRGEKSYAYFDKKEKEKIPGTEFPKKENKKIEFLNVIIPSPDTKLSDFISIENGILNEDLCDRILNEYKNNHNFTSAITGGGLNVDIRNCSRIGLSEQHIISENYDVRSKIDYEIFQSVQKALEIYSKKHPHFQINIDTGYELLEYKEGQFYKEHVDSFSQQQRSLSCSIALNEDFEGGEFAFFNRQIQIRSPKGSAIIFPSNFMFPHEIMPVKRGTRYSIITWFV
jgi:2OG-Fe(II) oxygenase superfamily